jgi:hypothetical protein
LAIYAGEEISSELSVVSRLAVYTREEISSELSVASCLALYRRNIWVGTKELPVESGLALQSGGNRSSIEII